ncbi:MAG: hypothetical protein IJ731_06355 [Eubacterium sp.]|nr:hypothetical protein [Eubacterium sp.]
MMKVRYGAEEDFSLVQKIDDSIIMPEFKKWVNNRQVLLIYENDDFAGWLQYSFFLERIPMINYFSLFEEFRGIGDGTLSLLIWERQMMERMYDKFMVAINKTDENAIRFFEEKGYKQIGDVNIPNEEEKSIYFKFKPLF